MWQAHTLLPSAAREMKHKVDVCNMQIADGPTFFLIKLEPQKVVTALLKDLSGFILN